MPLPYTLPFPLGDETRPRPRPRPRTAPTLEFTHNVVVSPGDPATYGPLSIYRNILHV